PTEVICAHGSSILWIDYVPARVLTVVKTPLFYAAGLEDSSIIVYTLAGRRALPTLSLDSPISILAAAGRYLMAICVNGAFHTWNVQTKTTSIPPTSIAHQVTGATGGITQAKIYENGTSLITFASGTSIAWDSDLAAWVRLAENWWRQSTQQQSHHRSSGRTSEPGLSPITPTAHAHGAGEVETPLAAALTLGALETRLHASKLLGSPTDYRSALMVYAGRLADDNLVERADELVRELCGPVFWDPSRSDKAHTSKWEPKVLGMSKRDLLAEILPVLEYSFNHRYHYPYVFLNEEPFTEQFKEWTSNIASSKVAYGIIPRDHWYQPAHIDETKARANRDEMVRNDIIYGGSVSPGVDFFCDVEEDPFVFLQENNKVYGFTISMYEYESTIPTLWETTMDFIKENPQYVAEDNAMRFLSDDGQKYNLCHFWSNFEIADMDFWRSEAYMKYFEYLDAKGGFYYERWGDAPVHSIGVGLFARKDQIHFFKQIGYRHSPFQHCPQGNLHEKGKCWCDKNDNFDYD
ncbi:alpha 1,2-mannosyltransferase 2.4.1, partial [Serendipita sp. 399]